MMLISHTTEDKSNLDHQKIKFGN